MICKVCTERVESFDQFYEEIHKNQEKFEQQQAIDQAITQQKDEIRYIILLKDNNKAEIQLKEIEYTDQGTFIDIPQVISETITNEEQYLEPSATQLNDVSALPESICKTNEKTSQEEISAYSEEESEVELQMMPETSLITVNLENFPKVLIVDGKLIIKGKELSKLIAKFYQLECNLCTSKKKFRKFSAMINHYKNEHSTKGFVSCCGLKIVKVRQIAMHMARHIQPEAFKCPSCMKMLTCPKILQYHIQNHLPETERNLACPEPSCNRRFSYQSALVTHSISHLPEAERTSFCCETCGRKFSTTSRLSAHINTVHDKSNLRKEFTCEFCSKIFLCKSNLAYHLTTHKNFEFQVECAICKKWLKNKICLRKHMAIHSDLKHYCDLCDYSAVNKQCLMNHRKVQHSNVKPFSCGVSCNVSL